jgi:hypothetical protein
MVNAAALIELIIKLTTRLRVVEERCKLLSKSNADKDRATSTLEEENRVLRSCLSSPTDRPNTTHIVAENLALRKQIEQMESFLADYGLVWIGQNEELESGPDTEDAHEGAGPCFDFDQLFRRIEARANAAHTHTPAANAISQELNDSIGADSSKVVVSIERTRAHAKFAVDDGVAVSFFANGVFVKRGPLRPYGRASAKVMNAKRACTSDYRRARRS